MEFIWGFYNFGKDYIDIDKEANEFGKVATSWYPITLTKNLLILLNNPSKTPDNKHKQSKSTRSHPSPDPQEQMYPILLQITSRATPPWTINDR